MRNSLARILSNREIAQGHYKMVLNAPDIARTVRPGQFVHVRCTNVNEPLLRRPFSIYKVNEKKKVIEILYKVIGKGTAILSKRRKDEELDMIGPLGTPFKIERGIKEAIIVGGGMGIASLYLLAEEISKHNNKIMVKIILGARSKNLIIGKEDLIKLKGINLQIATEDGSTGFKGLATELLKDSLKNISRNPGLIYIYGCGPQPSQRVWGFPARYLWKRGWHAE
ncbi:MAG: dihydroorotate dehydrogenase electron transfer subunit [Candidatus Omnitrophica bacterium]|nr:dihydroorotate dehydrogenase electron transfer subunit [Candidatus Omnitrophota bacterium]